MKRGESRWPAAAAIVVALASELLLSPALLPGPAWLLPGLEGVLLTGLVAADPNRLTQQSRDLRLPSLALLGVIAAGNTWALVNLIDELVNGGGNGRDVLSAAAGVWVTNVVVFALAYWETDRGGPLGRAGARAAPAYPELWFPQDGDAAPVAPPGWHPVFVDYLFVSVTASTAFSPTDTMPLTPRAKFLMGAQGLVSLTTIGLVAARAVNILGS
ncbi:MAG: conserved rane protein of unknown function [Frankiales bacterium]|nr:conserved rane protein of unknown function [Frankiales bacterium]